MVLTLLLWGAAGAVTPEAWVAEVEAAREAVASGRPEAAALLRALGGRTVSWAGGRTRFGDPAVEALADALDSGGRPPAGSYLATLLREGRLLAERPAPPAGDPAWHLAAPPVVAPGAPTWLERLATRSPGPGRLLAAQHRRLRGPEFLLGALAVAAAAVLLLALLGRRLRPLPDPGPARPRATTARRQRARGPLESAFEEILDRIEERGWVREVRHLTNGRILASLPAPLRPPFDRARRVQERVRYGGLPAREEDVDEMRRCLAAFRVAP